MDSCGRAMLNLEIGYIHDQAPSERGDVVSDEVVCEIRWLRLSVPMWTAVVERC